MIYVMAENGMPKVNFDGFMAYMPMQIGMLLGRSMGTKTQFAHGWLCSHMFSSLVIEL